MTMRKFADQIGVSVATVSKAFSGSSEISEATRTMIFEKARELGCFERFHKEKKHPPLVALLCPELTSEYYCVILKNLTQMLEKANVATVISVTNFSLETEENQIGYFASEGRADGIIMIEGQSVAKKYHSIPMVYINPFSENPFADTVSADFYSGIREAIWTFKTNGHRRIAYVGEPLTEDKKEFYLQAMESYGLPIREEWVRVSQYRAEEAGFVEAEKLFSSGEMPTAVLAAYDNIALGILHYLEAHGKSVPKDYSLVGIDNNSLAADRHISLSSISSNVEDVCRTATDILLQKMKTSGALPVQKIFFRSVLVNRGSIGKV